MAPPRLPGPQDFNGIPSANSGRAIVRDNSAQIRNQGVLALAQGVDRFGAGLNNIAVKVKAKQEAAEEFGVTKRYLEFQQSQSLLMSEAQRNISPGESVGFTDRTMAIIEANNRAFMETVPARLRNQFDVNLTRDHGVLFGSGYDFENEQVSADSVLAIQDHVTNVATPQYIAAGVLWDTDGEVASLAAFDLI